MRLLHISSCSEHTVNLYSEHHIANHVEHHVGASPMCVMLKIAHIENVMLKMPCWCA